MARLVVWVWDDFDGGDRDITEEVKILYDALIGSMDWGSDFLDVCEIEAAIKIGKLLDLNLPSDWERQLEARKKWAEHERLMEEDDAYRTAWAEQERQKILDSYVEEGKLPADPTVQKGILP